ncbi:dihydropteroate synthase [Brachyspira sp. CAG:484]|nr:dihydropteroate synthase [Brachyspira sp. CAG:484]
MHDFVLKEICNADLALELSSVGFDRTYINRAVQKYAYKNIKIYSLSIPQANILKQTALSVGADCATHRETITAKVETSDCILGGSISQLGKIAEKLKMQPFGLKELAGKIDDFLKQTQRTKPEIMGILNVTDNSFSDGGLYTTAEKAFKHLLDMVKDGADIIDIGAESTKPYSNAVPPDIQLKKIIPVLELVQKEGISVPVSIDTRSAKVAQECIKLGASIINDVSGFDYDKNMCSVIAANPQVKIVIQHSKGTPDVMQNNTCYGNLIDEIYLGLREKVNHAFSQGISSERIIIDPGIGFGKSRAQNFEIIRRLEEFKGLGCRLLLGISRKSLLNMPDAENNIKDTFTLALNTLALEHGADILRVHNVKLHRCLLDILCEN